MQGSNYDFVASNSDQGKELVKKFNVEHTVKETLIVIKNGELFTRSDAIFEIIDDMPKRWALFKITKIIPRNMRDRLYDIISRNRHRLYSKYKIGSS